MRAVVVGSGVMGPGIAQVLAMAGYKTNLVDADADQIERAEGGIRNSFERLVRSEKLSEQEAAESLDRIKTSTDLSSAARGVDVAIEAVTEVKEAKVEVLEELAWAAGSDALLGSNTSQLSITELAAPLGRAAERMLGIHFFNPAVVMKLVELIPGRVTSSETVQRAREVIEGLGKTPVVCRRDVPGFITTRLSAILRLESMRIVEEGLASAEEVDTAVKLAFNHPMGPLELGDFNGHDVLLRATHNLREVHGERFRAPALLRNLVAAGHLGRKSGQGFYSYDESGRRIEGTGE